MIGSVITVIGIGDEGVAGLSPAARAALSQAQVLAGGARHLDMAAAFAGPRVDWAAGLEAGLDALAQHVIAGRRVAVLASGDPLHYGVGKNLIERFGAERVRVLPAPGAVSLACAAMGWPQPEVRVLTVHGRPLEALNLYLTPGAKLVVLSEDGGTPARAAALLSERGFGPSRITVLEHLGGAREARLEGRAEGWRHGRCADLNTLAIEVAAGADARPLTRLAGLPDDAYEHDGQLTKRAVRAVTLSSLAPLPGQTLWDLGAGAGSIAIEWLRADASTRAVAVERDPVRAARIRANADTLGVPRLHVETADVLAALAALPGAPDAIFAGGAVAIPGMLEAAWARLKPGGRLVANAVTADGAQALAQLQRTHGGELLTIAVTHRHTADGAPEIKAPITQYQGIKDTQA